MDKILRAALSVLVAGLIGFAVLDNAYSSSSGLGIVKDGVSDYTIVVGEDASKSEVFAAQELRKYLKKISGADILIKKDNEDIKDKMIVIGVNKKTKKLKVKVDLEYLEDDGFVIKTKGSNLILAGGRKRGTLYSVYDFLERIGCRWYTAARKPHMPFSGEVIPKKKTIRIEPLDITEKPVFRYRAVGFYQSTIYMKIADYKDWVAKNKLDYNAVTAERGGVSRYMTIGHHSFKWIIPHEKYFATHPEYFALIKGERGGKCHGLGQICTTNPEVIKIATEYVLNAFKRGATVAQVTQNDGYGWCECDKCRALDAEKGVYTDRLITFVNEIAKRVYKEYPDRYIYTMVYTQYTEPPPLRVKPHKNIIIYFCHYPPYGACHLHPINSCEFNRKSKEHLEGWAKMTNNLHILDYDGTYQMLMPYPTLSAIKENIPYFKRLGVKGVMILAGALHGQARALYHYLEAKLLWNPDLDMDKLMDDFCQGYFGKAGSVMKKYYMMFEEQAKKKNVHMHVENKQIPANLFTQDFLQKCEKVLDKAEKLAETEEIRMKIEMERLGIDYVKLALSYPPEIKDGFLFVKRGNHSQAELDRFVKKCNLYRIGFIESGGKGYAGHKYPEEFVERLPKKDEKYKVVTLENEFVRMDILPEIGGRIYRLINKKKGMNYMYNNPDFPRSGGRWLNYGGYEEYSGTFADPGWNENYKYKFVKEKEGQKLILTAELSNGYLLSREISLKDNSQEVEVNSTLKNISKKSKKSRLRIHPVLVLGEDAKDDYLYVSAGGNKLKKKPLGKSETLWFEKEQLPEGLWMIVDEKENIGLLNYFNKGEIDIAFISNDGQICYNLELMSKFKMLKPGESLSVNHRYVLIDDVRKMLKKYELN